MDEIEPERGMRRRTLVQGAAAIGALVAIGVDVSLDASAALATPPSLSSVLNTAIASRGKKWNEGGWYTYEVSNFDADWCAQFVSWLLGEEIMPRMTHVSSTSTNIRSYFTNLGRFGSTPTVGSLVIYGDPGDHVGIVQSVDGNGTAIPIEGNAGDAPYYQTIVKWRNGQNGDGYGTSWAGAPLGYCYPVYYQYDSMTGVGNPGASDPGDEYEMTDVIYYADTTQGPRYSSGGITVELESMWYQECPGAPLYPLTGGFAYTATAAVLEYGAFSQTRSAVNAKRYACSAAQVASLIQLRGTTTKPIGNFAA